VACLAEIVMVSVAVASCQDTVELLQK